MFDRRKRSLSRRLLAAAKLKKPIFGGFFRDQIRIFHPLSLRTKRGLGFLTIVKYCVRIFVLCFTKFTPNVLRKLRAFVLILMVFTPPSTQKTEFVLKSPQKWVFSAWQQREVFETETVCDDRTFYPILSSVI